MGPPLSWTPPGALLLSSALGSRERTPERGNAFPPTPSTLHHPHKPGVRALYKGLSFPFTAQLVFKSVIFSTNGFAKREMAKRGIADSKAATFLCGALSGEKQPRTPSVLDPACELAG